MGYNLLGPSQFKLFLISVQQPLLCEPGTQSTLLVPRQRPISGHGCYMLESERRIVMSLSRKNQVKTRLPLTKQRKSGLPMTHHAMAETDRVHSLYRISEFPLIWLWHFRLAVQHTFWSRSRENRFCNFQARMSRPPKKFKVLSQLTSKLSHLAQDQDLDHAVV
jgi:hypothetical protein